MRVILQGSKKTTWWGYHEDRALLEGNWKMGIYISPHDSGVKVWADYDFRGNWFSEDATDDSDTACSCSGSVVSYLGCPVMWNLQLQTEISLSSTESEYIALIQSLRKTIPIIEILKEMRALGYNVVTVLPTVLCKLFEDNSGALILVRDPSTKPRKNISIQSTTMFVHILPTLQYPFFQLSQLSNQQIC